MKGVVKSMDIGIDKMIDRDQMHLEVLNRMPVNMLAITAKRSGTEYEINDGKIVAEITNVK
jgi:hypothetical protein